MGWDGVRRPFHSVTYRCIDTQPLFYRFVAEDIPPPVLEEAPALDTKQKTAPPLPSRPPPALPPRGEPVDGNKPYTGHRHSQHTPCPNSPPPIVPKTKPKLR